MKIEGLKDFRIDSLFTVEKATKAEDGEDYITIEGYANTKDEDRHGDVIQVEAWTKNGGLNNYQKNPIVLAFHDHSRPVGRVTELAVDEKGLKVKAQIMKSATDVYEFVKAGVLRAFSIGGRIKDMSYDKDADVFVVKDIELHEISVVSVPANQESLFSVSKCFGTTEEFQAFKKQFLPSDDSTKKDDGANGNAQDEFNMTKEELAALVKSALDQKEEERLQAEKAAKEAETRKAADIQVLQSSAEKLVGEVEARLEKAMKDGLDAQVKGLTEGLAEQIAEQRAEIEALLKSKAGFGDRNNGNQDPISIQEKESAIILAKTLSRRVEDTKYGKSLIEKAGPHYGGAGAGEWEHTVSNNMQADIRRRLVVAPLFKTITMPTPTMRFPINPEAGVANWVAATDYGTTASSGTAQVHQLNDVLLQTYKLATKEFITNEEDEDSVLALAPIIRDAVVRRMARAIDQAHLRGQGAGSDPLNGVAKIGDATGTTASVTTAASVATLTALRRKLGVWGLDPSDLIYVVSTEIYYDLLDDTTFQTVDKVGSDRATLLTGQIGYVAGTPVVVSGEFEAKAATKYGAICLNKSNFMRGEQVGLRVESDYIVQEQRRVLVASQRMAFQQITTANGSGVATFKWVA